METQLKKRVFCVFLCKKKTFKVKYMGFFSVSNIETLQNYTLLTYETSGSSTFDCHNTVVECNSAFFRHG